MNLTTILSNISGQLRISPISPNTSVLQWFTQAIKTVCTKSAWLEKFSLIAAKKDASKYFLPGDHIATTGVLFDGVSLERINAKDIEFVAPTTPVYYYEDNWEDEASEAIAGEFAMHYAHNEFWPLQLMRSQQSAGTKTLTLVAAPTEDGTTADNPIVGVLDGTVDSDSLIWSDTRGIVSSVISSEKNILIFYKYVDTLPVDQYSEVTYSDLMGILYSIETLSLALSTENDEYDRYRSWLYSFISTSVCSMLRDMAISRRFR